MDKILVPIDFSASSDWGFYYAYEMAKKFNATLVALHLYTSPYLEPSMPANMIQSILDETEANILIHLKQSTQPSLIYKEEKPVNIEYIIEPYTLSSITDVARRIDADLIIMGTHGADRAWDKVWGTNTSNVINQSPCPVLAIPSQNEFKGLNNLAYATDYTLEDVANIAQLLSFAEKVNAKLHCVHINVVGKEDKVNKSELFQSTLQQQISKELLERITFSVRSAISVEDGLETFLRINKIEILSMLTHKRSLWEKIMNNKSITQSMAMRARTPLLAFHK